MVTKYGDVAVSTVERQHLIGYRRVLYSKLLKLLLECMGCVVSTEDFGRKAFHAAIEMLI